MKTANWVTKGLDENVIGSARELATEMARKGISTSQIRNIFGELKKIQALGVDSEKGKARLYMVGPKIAYSIGRLEKRDKEKKEVFSKLLNEVEQSVGSIVESDERKRFDNFVEYMEAIVAYHRYETSMNDSNNRR
jgi:CRISPR-associated protein Csm2